MLTHNAPLNFLSWSLKFIKEAPFPVARATGTGVVEVMAVREGFAHRRG
jgi:hypothetical protein